jgi:hypothetical protein
MLLGDLLRRFENEDIAQEAVLALGNLAMVAAAAPRTIAELNALNRAAYATPGGRGLRA